MENADKYPEKVRDILYKDIFQREENDPVRIAYELAAKLHEGQTRKGILQHEYITHPLQVYDMVKKCIGDDDVPDKDVTLAAALLHDAVEDYGKDDHNKSEEEKRAAAIYMIEDGFTDLARNHRFTNLEFAEKLIDLLIVLSLPTKGLSDEEKRSHQVAVAKTASANAKLIKICDQTLNITSNTEEVPNWDYLRLMKYTNKATAVANSAFRSTKKSDPYYKAINIANAVYTHISDETLEIYKRRKSEGKSFPPEAPVRIFDIEELINVAQTSIDKPKSQVR